MFNCDFLIMAYISFFSLHNSFKTIFTSATFLRCWSFLTVILETNTSHVSDFKEVATPIIDYVICSGSLFDAKSFVPTWTMIWSGFSCKVDFMWSCMSLILAFGKDFTYVLQLSSGLEISCPCTCFSIPSPITYVLLHSSDEFLFF